MPTSMAAKPLIGLDYDDSHVLSAAALRFAVGDEPSGPDPSGDARRLIAAANSAIERRGNHGEPDLDELEISLVYTSRRNRYRANPVVSAGYAIDHGHAGGVTPAHVAAWLRFAARRVTGRVTVAVPPAAEPDMAAFDEDEAKRKFVAGLPAYARAEATLVMFGPDYAVLPEDEKTTAVRDKPEPERKKQLVAELPASARAEAMRLALGNASLTVPHAAAGAFAALTELRLSHARIEPGSASEANLGRLLSASCCPRLRRARLEHVQGLAALRIEPSAADTLEELSLDRLPDMTSLELDAPGLCALRVVGCGRMLLREASAVIHAPRLEHLACGTMCHPETLDFNGLETVRRLENLHLWSHLHERRRNACALWLLEQCASMDSLGVRIAPPMGGMCAMATEETMSLVPPLPNVKALEISVHASCGQASHRLASSVGRLVARCGGLRRLSVAFSESDREPCSSPACFCRMGEDEEPMEMSLEHLEEVRIAGFCPRLDHHVGLVMLLVASAPALARMTLECDVLPEGQEKLLPCDRGCSATRVIGGAMYYEWPAPDG